MCLNAIDKVINEILKQSSKTLYNIQHNNNKVEYKSERTKDPPYFMYVYCQAVGYCDYFWRNWPYSGEIWLFLFKH